MSLINTDIYNIRESIENLKKDYIPEDEETLALGIFGYIGDIEAKKIQTTVMMVGELENEVFPNRAKLDKNVITHAIMQNIENINATPATMTVVIGIDTEDLDRYMINNKFIIDKDCPFIISSDDNIDFDFEYHLDYDVVLTRSSSSNESFAAIYDISRKNKLSTIDNPYLKQPYTVKMNDKKYVFFQCALRQIAVKTEYKQITSNNTIDNKTMTFSFEDQLADFEINVKQNNKEYFITPIFEGAGVPTSVEYYCYYTYINTNTIRIKFDNTSFIPALNSEITVNIKTTKGSDAVFTYKKPFYATLNSKKYDYANVITLLRPNTDSIGGVNRKSVEELHSIIPKEMMSRGSITTETDLSNYFNLLNTEENRLEIVKKIDNQIDRIYYGYFVMKNSDGNIVPTNSIDLELKESDFYIYEDNGTLVLPAGTLIELDPETFVGRVVDSSDSDYTYRTIYTLMINTRPLYTAFYMCIVNTDPYLSFDYINQDTPIQFISERVHMERHLLDNPNLYSFTFNTNQSIIDDVFKLGIDKMDYDEMVPTLKKYVKAIMILYKNGVPYRYRELDMIDFDPEIYQYTFDTTFETDNMFDVANNIKINDLYVTGSVDKNYGYLNDSTEAYIYVLAKFDSECGKHDFSDAVPGYSGWSVTNKYEIYNGLTFFENYTSLMNTRVSSDNKNFKVSNVPLLGDSYIRDESYVFDFIDQINYKKMYIDNALYVLENSFEIDFKFYNTYGPSRIYTVDDEGTEPIGRVDVSLTFRMSLKSSSDVYTESSIIASIKEYIESLDELEDLHIPNLTSYIKEKYKNTINYFEYCGFNDFDANYQHMYKQEVLDKNITPEFINVRNYVDSNGKIQRCIRIIKDDQYGRVISSNDYFDNVVTEQYNKTLKGGRK